MKRMIAILLLATSATAVATHRRASSLAAGELRIVFVTPESDMQQYAAALDVGVIRNSGGRRGAPATVEQTIAVRIERGGDLQVGTASLRASVVTGDPRVVVRIDGMKLDALPRLIDGRVPVGATRPHRVTVEVPPSVPAGAIGSSIVWEVTSE